MALFKSTYFAQIVNKIAGTVFLYNRYGTIVGRSWAKPVDVNSNALEQKRSEFNASVAAWKSLTQIQRDAWTDFAKDTPWKNALGDTVFLTGQAMYIGQVGAVVDAFGFSYRVNYNEAPCVPGLFPTPLLEVACCNDPDLGIIVTVTNQDSTNLMNAIVRISRPQNTSRNHFKGPYTGSEVILLSGIVAGGSDDAEFCELCEGRYFIEVRGYDGTNNNNMSTLTHIFADACTAAP